MSPQSGARNSSPPVLGPTVSARKIEISLRNINQLFNSMDPSPFHERDLDRDAEEFLVSWAQEYPSNSRLKLVLHLTDKPAIAEPEVYIQEAVNHYFGYRARLNKLELQSLLQQGRVSLLIGASFLAACLLASETIARHLTGTLADVLREGMTIAGWVAMWRPMQIYLYEWWPIQRMGRIYKRMSRMKVEVKVAPDHSA